MQHSFMYNINFEMSRLNVNLYLQFYFIFSLASNISLATSDVAKRYSGSRTTLRSVTKIILPTW